MTSLPMLFFFLVDAGFAKPLLQVFSSAYILEWATEPKMMMVVLIVVLTETAVTAKAETLVKAVSGSQLS